MPYTICHILIALCCCLFAGACEDELRVPYILPTLANWPQPYRGVNGLKLHVFNTGQLRVAEALVFRGGSLRHTRELPVPAFLIEHPQQGLILFNTGLEPAPPQATPVPTARVGPLIGVETHPNRGLRHALERAGFRPDAVRWIVLGNLRPDHVGEVRQFSNAQVVTSRAEHAHAAAAGGSASGIIGAVGNWKLIDFSGTQPLGTFPNHTDLFGDGSCLLINAAGFTPGNLMMLVRLAERPVLLADDAAPTVENLQYGARPVGAYDMRKWWDNLWRLKRFKDLAPELVVLPAHDQERARAAALKGMVVHAEDS